MAWKLGVPISLTKGEVGTIPIVSVADGRSAGFPQDGVDFILINDVQQHGSSISPPLTNIDLISVKLSIVTEFGLATKNAASGIKYCLTLYSCFC